MGAVILPVKLKLNITDIIFWLSVQPQMYVCIGKPFNLVVCVCVCVGGKGGGEGAQFETTHKVVSN